jgi:hypothetical protein
MFFCARTWVGSLQTANENSAKDKITLFSAWISRKKAFMQLYDIFGGRVGSATPPFLMFFGQMQILFGRFLNPVFRFFLTLGYVQIQGKMTHFHAGLSIFQDLLYIQNQLRYHRIRASRTHYGSCLGSGLNSFKGQKEHLLKFRSE